MKRLSVPELPTLWRLPDPLWELAQALIDQLDPPKPTGRPRNDARATLDAIVFRMRTGCQWNHLPAEFPDDRSVHRWLQRWRRLGLWDRLWAELVTHCDALGAVDWHWQAADGQMVKARMGGGDIGPNPTDRGKPGTKRSLLCEGQGGPLAVVTDGANVHDSKLLRATLEAVIVPRPEPLRTPQHLCLDKAYDTPAGHLITLAQGYLPQIRLIGERKESFPVRRHPPRRWVVERTLAWLSKCRGLLVRYEKNPENFLAQLKLACALLWYRRCWRLAQAA